MRKNLLYTMLFLLNMYVVNAQQGSFSAITAKPFAGISHHFAPSPNGACDTLNLDSANNDWRAYYYPYGTNASSGFVFGVSDLSAYGYNIQEDANFFDASSSDYNYVSGGLAYFAFANSNVPENLDSDIVFKIYDDAGGVPGAVLGSATIKFSQVHDDVLANNLTEFLFATPVAIPASKMFYVSIDHSALRWKGETHDSLAIVANADDESTAAAYQYIKVNGQGNAWTPVNQFWSGTGGNPLDINLFIFPYMSNSLDGCTPLPVSILNFTGSVKNNQAHLSWSTATELNNKGFEIERSKDGQNYATIGFVKGAGNSNQIRNYSYTDATIKDFGSSTTYYRLKQVDIDGRATYSKILPLRLDMVQFFKLFPNPVKDKITFEFSLTTASKVSVQVISHDGRIVMNIDKGILAEGSQVISIDGKTLAGGSYMVRLTAGDKAYTQSFIKE